MNFTIAADSDILIGQNHASTRQFKGWIDEVVVCTYYTYNHYYVVQVAIWNNAINISRAYQKYQDPSSDLALTLYLP